MIKDTKVSFGEVSCEYANDESKNKILYEENKNLKHYLNTQNMEIEKFKKELHLT